MTTGSKEGLDPVKGKKTERKSSVFDQIREKKEQR